MGGCSEAVCNLCLQFSNCATCFEEYPYLIALSSNQIRWCLVVSKSALQFCYVSSGNCILNETASPFSLEKIFIRHRKWKLGILVGRKEGCSTFLNFRIYVLCINNLSSLAFVFEGLLLGGSVSLKELRSISRCRTGRPQEQTQ